MSLHGVSRDEPTATRPREDRSITHTPTTHHRQPSASWIYACLRTDGAPSSTASPEPSLTEDAAADEVVEDAAADEVVEDQSELEDVEEA